MKFSRRYKKYLVIISFKPFGEVPIQSIEAQLAGLESFTGVDWTLEEIGFLQTCIQETKKHFMFGMVTQTQPEAVSISHIAVLNLK